jgi:hypothetical protein
VNSDLDDVWYTDMYIDLDLSTEAASRAMGAVAKGMETVHLSARKKKKHTRDKKDKAHNRAKDNTVRPRIHVQVLYVSEAAQELPMPIQLLEKQLSFPHTALTLANDFTTEGAAADRARLQWHFNTMLTGAFAVIDTEHRGVISAVQIYRVMECLGERLSMDELADLLGEATLDMNPQQPLDPVRVSPGLPSRPPLHGTTGLTAGLIAGYPVDGMRH